MKKNFFLLGLLVWVTSTYAKNPVVRPTMAEAETYKVEKPSEDQEAQRSVAGGKIKKKKKLQKMEEAPKVEEASGTDSEVQYWQYSE